VSVEHLRLVAGSSERAARCELGRSFASLCFLRAPFAVGFGRQLCRGALLPVTGYLQIGCAQKPLTQSQALRGRHRRHLPFGVVPSGLGAGRFGARAGGALRALAEHTRFAIDALLAQPMEGLERITVTHGEKSSKRWPEPSTTAVLARFYWDFSDHARRWRFAFAEPRLHRRTRQGFQCAASQSTLRAPCPDVPGTAAAEVFPPPS